MIGIVVPVHNEERHLKQCLQTLWQAAVHPELGGEAVNMHFVLDACTDGSENIIRNHSLSFSSDSCLVSHTALNAHNVGLARANGAEYMIRQGARWLAFTDGDTRVAPDWLAIQLRLNVDVVCGTVAVEDWSMHGEYAEMLHEHFSKTYHDADGHRHIHGANIGVSTDAYLRAGGFSHLTCHEDVALVAALEKIGARFAWSAAPRVVTSARKDARARNGFGDTMLAIVASHHQALMASP